MSLEKIISQDIKISQLYMYMYMYHIPICCKITLLPNYLIAGEK